MDTEVENDAAMIFSVCLQVNHPVLVINNTVGAHEWHRLRFGTLTKEEVWM